MHARTTGSGNTGMKKKGEKEKGEIDGRRTSEARELTEG